EWLKCGVSFPRRYVSFRNHATLSRNETRRIVSNTSRKGSAMRSIHLFLAAAAVAAVALLVGAMYAAASQQGAAVQVRSTSLGPARVALTGKPFARGAPDRGASGPCYGACASYGPPMLPSGRPAAGTGAVKKLLGTTRRTDGHVQVTYAGHPL